MCMYRFRETREVGKQRYLCRERGKREVGLRQGKGKVVGLREGKEMGKGGYHSTQWVSIYRYVVQQNRILSDYPTIWPKEKFAVKKDELYDLTPDEEGQ